MAHVVVVEVSQVAVVERRSRIVREHVANVARDPLAGSARSIRLRRYAARRNGPAVPGIQQHGGAVGKNEQGGVAASGVDLMDVERAGRPTRERLPHLLRKA